MFSETQAQAFSQDLAIDLGTANMLVFLRGVGITINEPSIVAIHDADHSVVAVGRDAKAMLGRTPGRIRAIRPLKDGVIADFDLTEKILAYLISKARERRRTILRPRVVIGVPAGITHVERRAVRTSVMHAGAREVYLIEESMAAAIGAGLPVSEPGGNLQSGARPRCAWRVLHFASAFARRGPSGATQRRLSENDRDRRRKVVFLIRSLSGHTTRAPWSTGLGGGGSG